MLHIQQLNMPLKQGYSKKRFTPLHIYVITNSRAFFKETFLNVRTPIS